MGNHLLSVDRFWTDLSLLEAIRDLGVPLWFWVYSKKSNGRGGGAIITAGFKCVQMTVGTRLHTTRMRRGDDHRGEFEEEVIQGDGC